MRACRCLVLENSGATFTFYIFTFRKTIGMDAPDYNPFPVGSRVEVWWTGDKMWYAARVTDARIELHKIKGAMVPCHEVYSVYELDDHEQWHSLHNNKIRKSAGATRSTFHNHDICPVLLSNVRLGANWRELARRPLWSRRPVKNKNNQIVGEFWLHARCKRYAVCICPCRP